MLSLSGIDGLPAEVSLSFDMPRRGEYADGRPGRPSGGKKIALSIPAGEHDLMIGGGDGNPSAGERSNIYNAGAGVTRAVFESELDDVGGFIFPLFGWGIPLAAHAVYAYVVRDAEEIMVQRAVHRTDDQP